MRSLKVATLAGDEHECTVLREAVSSFQLAVGYKNGSVKIFNLSSGELQATFNGHKSSVTCLSFDENCMRLVSGSKVCFQIFQAPRCITVDIYYLKYDVTGQSSCYLGCSQ